LELRGAIRRRAWLSPQLLAAPDDIGEEDRARLRALRGQRLLRSWAVWAEWTVWEPNGRVRRKESAWLKDGRLILEFETARLELAAWKTETCLSWDTIDIAQGMHWGDEDNDFRTWWRVDALEPLTALRDPLDEVLAVEWYDALGLASVQARHSPSCSTRATSSASRTYPARRLTCD
jgi:hypothetical protein